jgi:hypothetical protein
MEREDRRMLGGAEADQERPEQRPVCEIERPPNLRRRNPRPLDRGPLRRQSREIDQGQLDADLVPDHLLRPAQHVAEGGAERLVTAGDLFEAVPEPLGRERAREAHRRRDVVERRVRLELIEEPEALLGKRERPRSALRARLDRSRRHPLSVSPSLDRRRERFQRRMLEQRPDGHLDPESLAHPRQQARALERVAAEVEEVVPHPHPLDAQKVGPQPGEDLLHRRPRREPLLSGWSRRILPGRESPPVHLAVRSPRQLRQHDQERRHQKSRQLIRKGRPQLGGIEHLRRHEAHQPPAVCPVLGSEHRGLGDARQREQRRLDLAQLDAETPNLDLPVQTAEELQLAILPPPHPVAGAVQACPRLQACRVGPEAVRREIRPAEVAASQTCPAEPQLARHAHRHRLQPAVEHTCDRSRQRPADRRSPCPALDPRAGRVRGVFGRPVEIPQLLDPRQSEHRLGQLAPQRFAGQIDRAHGAGHRPLPHQLGHGRRHGVDQRHEIARREPRQGECVVREDDGAAEGQGDEDLEDGEVEGDRGGRQNAGPTLRRVGRRRPGDAGHGAAVAHADAFRGAGRAGGVDEVGETVRKNALTPGPSPISHPPPAGRGENFDRETFLDDEPRSAVPYQVIEPLLRIGRIERQVGSAGP